MDGTGPRSRPFSPMKTHSRRPASVDSRGPRGDRTVAACGARCPWGREPRPAVPVPSGARCPTSHAQPAPFLAGCFFSKEVAVSRGSFAVWPLTALQLTLHPGTRVMPASGARGAATSLYPSGSRGTSQRRPHVQTTSKFPVDRDAPGMRVPEGGRWGDLADTRLAACPMDSPNEHMQGRPPRPRGPPVSAEPDNLAAALKWGAAVCRGRSHGLGTGSPAPSPPWQPGRRALHPQSRALTPLVGLGPHPLRGIPQSQALGRGEGADQTPGLRAAGVRGGARPGPGRGDGTFPRGRQCRGLGCHLPHAGRETGEDGRRAPRALRSRLPCPRPRTTALPCAARVTSLHTHMPRTTTPCTRTHCKHVHTPRTHTPCRRTHPAHVHTLSTCTYIMHTHRAHTRPANAHLHTLHSHMHAYPAHSHTHIQHMLTIRVHTHTHIPPFVPSPCPRVLDRRRQPTRPGGACTSLESLVKRSPPRRKSRIR